MGLAWPGGCSKLSHEMAALTQARVQECDIRSVRDPLGTRAAYDSGRILSSRFHAEIAVLEVVTRRKATDLSAISILSCGSKTLVRG